MNNSEQSTSPRALCGFSIRFRPFVCLLLVGFLLYNPFLSLTHSSRGLSVHQLSRNRATVGAGELQNFSLATKVPPVDILSAECVRELVVVQTETEFPLATDRTPIRELFQEFSSNLFFRPPPSA
jgi:hypothetical protein